MVVVVVAVVGSYAFKLVGAAGAVAVIVGSVDPVESATADWEWLPPGVTVFGCGVMSLGFVMVVLLLPLLPLLLAQAEFCTLRPTWTLPRRGIRKVTAGACADLGRVRWVMRALRVAAAARGNSLPICPAETWSMMVMTCSTHERLYELSSSDGMGSCSCEESTR